jgi:hypothetical protein
MHMMFMIITTGAARLFQPCMTTLSGRFFFKIVM